MIISDKCQPHLASPQMIFAAIIVDQVCSEGLYNITIEAISYNDIHFTGGFMFENNLSHNAIVLTDIMTSLGDSYTVQQKEDGLHIRYGTYELGED